MSTPSLDDLTGEDLARAFERVLENHGCAGVDGETVERFSSHLDTHLRHLQSAIGEDQYRALPLLRIRIEKKPGAPAARTLLVPAVVDRVLQTAVARHLSRSFEDEFLEASYAYRPGRGVDRAIARVRQLRDEGYRYVVDADIRGYFDHIDHRLLLQAIAPRTPPRWTGWIHQWVAAPAWDGTWLRRRHQGLPQGAPISPLLANLYLQPFDLEMLDQQARVVRYADDFILLTRDRQSAEALLESCRVSLKKLALELQLEKTRVTSFDEGFSFLGVRFVQQDIWQRWKEKPAALGRLLHMAKPMPLWRLQEWRHPPAATVMQAALGRAGLQPWSLTPPAARPPETNMAYLYVTEPGAVVRKSGDRILVEQEDRIVLDIPYHKLEHVLLFGPVQVTTQAMGELLEKGVDLSLFSAHGQFRGSLTPPQSGNALDRIAQYELWKDSRRSLEAARAVVRGKLLNSLTVQQAWAKLSPQPLFAELGEAGEALLAQCETAPDRDTLLGYEGAAAKLHFRALAEANRSGFPFPGRRSHPATDPLNALLSLAYTLLTQELDSLLQSEGLDPCLGMLHAIDRGRPSLALDLLEAFRAPIADRLVVRAVNLKIINDRHFPLPAAGQACHLQAQGLKIFLAEYDRFLLAPPAPGVHCFRQDLRQEVRRVLESLRRQEVFVPYRWGGDAAPTELLAAEV